MKTEAALFAIAISGLFAQTATTPTWKEFSIAAPVKGGNRFGQFGMTTSRVTMKKALAQAYGVAENRIVGPAWLGTERYAITAQVADPKTFEPLFQQELGARFHLLAHREIRNIPVYILKSIDGSAPKQIQATPASAAGGERSLGGIRMSGTVKDFATTLADVIERPILNETGIDGTFDFNLSWKMGNLPALEAAVKEQLGMQLVEERRSVDLLIVDHIEKLQFPE